ncbi:methionyl-tRNA formyltransferase [Vallitalea okinawensis]|uniref:methionyl-tRNA formyltransferase n=1 Tax=Vallitalea okinawensis TaxID=2078660 RepID=UPI000CFC55FB|nr:methionyl-tRNA formyltransferase [Vallitalea okinawensis]
MKVVFMGTPDFAVPTLEALIEEYDVVTVLTQPDRPRGRGNKVTPSPVKEVALKYNIPVFQPEKLRKEEGTIAKLKEMKPDVIVVIAYGQILPREVLDIPKYGCINVHGSLLPKYRGAAPIQRSIIDGEHVTGVTTMYMDVGLDTGDMILKEEIAILDEDTAGSLHDKMSVVGAKVLIDTLKLIEKNEAPREKQDDALSTYATILKKKDGLIHWGKSNEEIVNLIRGLNPWPSAYTYLDGKILKVWGAKAVHEKDIEGLPGQIVDIENDNLIVKTGHGLVKICTVQLQGRKRMPVKEFLKGYQVDTTTVLGVNV